MESGQRNFLTGLWLEPVLSELQKFRAWLVLLIYYILKRIKKLICCSFTHHQRQSLDIILFETTIIVFHYFGSRYDALTRVTYMFWQNTIV